MLRPTLLLRRLRCLGGEILTAVWVTALFSLVEVGVRAVSLPRLAPRLGVRLVVEPQPTDAQPLDRTSLPLRAQRQLRWARRIADAWPFAATGPCLRHALVTGHLLRRRRPALRLGLGGTPDVLTAHAWLEIDGHPLEPLAQPRPFSRASPGTRR
jgi:hypothetical protein